ncbi:ribosomal L1 domain-containing protein 1 [Clupea harengus]|uniref:Ribosomal L1 domain-containing protein 1 n=1 Tax=Clupea harengus TaxID=7950 RepID=A0A6P3WBH6_CLUHA|nr:ribosomal L1 domain-containing protein 1 [Clupea harengus]
MRAEGPTREGSMAEQQGKLQLDRSQVKKAVLALQAFLKTKESTECLLLNESQHISLMFTMWKIPKKEQTIRIPLPHGIRTENGEVCLFTRDEPNMTSDQTERFFKKLLTERGVKNVTQVMPYKVLKTEYKAFEAKRRLLGNFDLFLSDARIRRHLPSHIGKHFYESKKAPLSVDLLSKNLGRDMDRLIQGTTVTVGKKGPCCMARVAHSGMTADEIVENVTAAVATIISKLNMVEKDKIIKLIHLKSQTSVALPIYSSDLGNLTQVEGLRNKTKKKPKKRKAPAVSGDATPKDGEEGSQEEKTTKEDKDASAEEEIPQLVPIQTPSKKAKLQEPKKKGVKTAAKPLVGRGKKQTKGGPRQAKRTAKASPQKPKRKAPKRS